MLRQSPAALWERVTTHIVYKHNVNYQLADCRYEDFKNVIRLVSNLKFVRLCIYIPFYHLGDSQTVNSYLYSGDSQTM